MSDAAPIDPNREYTATLTGMDWMNACSALMAAGQQLIQRDMHAEASQILDIPARIIKQIDPDGWADTGFDDLFD